MIVWREIKRIAETEHYKEYQAFHLLLFMFLSSIPIARRPIMTDKFILGQANI